MKKKIVISIAVILVLILGVIVGITIVNKNKVKPEDILEKYIEKTNEQNYKEMYQMLTEEAKKQISEEDFIKRNENIYEGIEMSNMEIKITNIEKEKDATSKISYTEKINTAAGKIEFSNIVRLSKNKEKGYLINWNSSLIFPQLGTNDKVRIKTVSAKRGEITDKNGNILAGEGEVSSIGIVPGKLGENKENSIKQISEILGISEENINKSLSSTWVKDDSFVPIKKVSKSETELKEKLLQIPGIKITTTKSRVYPLGEAAAQLIGYVQNITAEELKNNQDKGYTSNSVIGRAGLEKQYEERLKGTDGLEIYIENENGEKKAEIAKIDVQNGENIKLTIDSEIQQKLYEELKNDSGFFVVMQPETGKLLALVSTPSYNPEKFVLGMSTEEWNQIKENNQNPLTARYLQSWCPGSTFKPITGAIGLTSGSLSEEDTFSYNGLSWKKDNWGEYDITTLTAYNGAKNLRNALIHSDNIYFAQAALKIGKGGQLDELKDLGHEVTCNKSKRVRINKYDGTINTKYIE